MGLRPHLWAAIVPVTCPVHDTCLHETDLQSVFQGCVLLAFTFSLLFLWRGPFSLGSGRDRTSDVPSPCYVHPRDRLEICVAGGAPNRHVSRVCITGIQRDPCYGPLERVRTLLGVEWRISQLVERHIIRLG